MNSQIEENLRSALSSRASELGRAPGARVLARDYKPRSGVPRAAFIGGGAAIAAGIAAGLVISLSASTPRAFAGWSSSPTSAAAGQVQSADQTCRARLPVSASPESGEQAATKDWQAVLTDVRGPYIISIYSASEGKAVFSCFAGRDLGVATLGGVFIPGSATSVASGQVAIVSYGGNATPPDEGSARFSRLIGRAGPGVTMVSAKLADGTQVSATLSHGWFLAWWPGTARPVSTEVTTLRGARTQTIGNQLG